LFELVLLDTADRIMVIIFSQLTVDYVTIAAVEC